MPGAVLGAGAEEGPTAPVLRSSYSVVSSLCSGNVIGLGDVDCKKGV